MYVALWSVNKIFSESYISAANFLHVAYTNTSPHFQKGWYVPASYFFD